MIPFKLPWYRQAPPEKDCNDCVQHLDEFGEWCGPLIPSAEHSRAGELPEEVICIACGYFCEGVDAKTIALVKRLVARMDRAEEAEEKRGAQLAKLAAAGVDISTLQAETTGRRRPPRPRQLALFEGPQLVLPITTDARAPETGKTT